MKKTLFLMFLSVMILTVSQAQTKPASGDKSSAKEAIAQSLDKMYADYQAKDFEKVLAFMTEDCLNCGTDSKEFWDKAASSESFKRMSADTSVHMPGFKMVKREIRLAKDGNSAIVIEQFFINDWSSKIPVRNVSHLVNIKGKWFCDFMSSAFIPDNKDLDKIFKSVMQ